MIFMGVMAKKTPFLALLREYLPNKDSRMSDIITSFHKKCNYNSWGQKNRVFLMGT